MHRLLALWTILACSALVSGASGCAQTNDNIGGSSAPEDGEAPLDATNAADGSGADGAGGGQPPDGGQPSDGEARDSSADGAQAVDGETSDGSSDVATEAATPATTSPQPLLPTWGAYPRALHARSGDIVVSVIGNQASGRRGGTILRSSDDGVTFSEIGHIDDPSFASGVCCSTLYELPRAVGALPPGALLWAVSVGVNTNSSPMSIGVWSSVDVGVTWSKASDAVVASVPRSTGGLWEPEFSLLDDGRLVCHYSDETAPGHSQRLAAVTTTDVVAWTTPVATVAPNDSAARPGMANVRRGPGGTFFMSYELCGGTNYLCTAHMRTSSDGWNWGDPNSPGSIPKTVDGKTFRHAPTLAWSATPGAHGRFYLVGQTVYDSSGQLASENGGVIFANAQGGTGSWYEIAAPVPVPSPDPTKPCANYSSSLLPLDQDSVVLEVAGHYEGVNNVCISDFARGNPSPL